MKAKKIPCKHCAEKTNEKDLVDGAFCCTGCAGAYKLINDLGLKNYYESRINDPKIRNLKPDENEEIELESFISEAENGDFELFLAIDGLHCAACVWLIENVLQKEENVTLARVNLTRKYLRLRWKGPRKLGMKFVDLILRIGYKLYPFDEEILAKEEKKYSDSLVKKLAVAGFGAGNIMLFSITLWLYDASELGVQTQNMIHFFSALIALPCVIYSSSLFFKSALKALKNKRMNMDVTISTAIILTMCVSFYQIFHSANHVYFDSAMTLCFFLLIGRYLDFKTRKKAFNVGLEFSLLSSNFARIIDGEGNVRILAAKNVKKGMILLVNAGEKVVGDGEVISGESEVNNSVITGESRALAVKKGSQVFASAINIGNSIRVKVGKNQQESLLKQIQMIVEESENHKNHFVRIADRIAGYYTPIVHLAASLTFVIWYFWLGSGGHDAALNAIAVLVITCPCALALAVPIAQSLTISLALKNGIIVKSGEAIEKIAKIKSFVFDKTGTLTLGRPRVVAFNGVNQKLNKDDRKLYLQIAGNLAQNSSHPISKAICGFCEESGIDGGNFGDGISVKEKAGFGIEAEIDGFTAKLGKKDFVDGEMNAEENEVEAGENFSATYLSYKNDVVIFYLEDEKKPDAREFVASMKEYCGNLALVSGDDSKVVEKMASDLSFERYFAEKDPVEKVVILENLQREYGLTAFVGDGINDAGAMAKADVSISFGKATNLTQNIADVIINKDSLMPILGFVNLAKKSIRITKQNLIFCLVYNCFAVPFAVSGLVNPMMAAIAMSSSSLIVILNSLRLR